MNTTVITQKQHTLLQQADNLLALCQQQIHKHYLNELSATFPLPCRNSINTYDIRLLHLERLVLDNKATMLESLSAIYTALGNLGYSVFLFLDSNGSKTDFYLGIKANSRNTAHNGRELLEQSLNGHFGGSKVRNLSADKITPLFQHNEPYIAAASGVPTLAVEEREHFMQGIGRFIDAAEGKSYKALILAEPITKKQLNLIQRGYEEIASQLSPLMKQSLAYSQNQSVSVAESISQSLSESLGNSLSLTANLGESFGTNYSHSDSSSTTFSVNQTLSRTQSYSYSKVIKQGETMGYSLTKGNSQTVGNSQTNGNSNSFGVNHSTSFSRGTTSGVSYNRSHGTNQGTTDTYSSGENQQLTVEFTNKPIEKMIAKIEQNLERIDEARNYGAWHSAAYFITDNTISSQSLSSLFLSLMRGNNSNSEEFALTSWNKEQSAEVFRWLSTLSHPHFRPLNSALNVDYITPATLVSGRELAVQLGLPRRSTSTITVIETKPFGRNIQPLTLDTAGETNSQKRTIDLGQIRHLWQDTQQRVLLDVDSLTGHLFVSGSTGSGKSNAVYQLLHQLDQQDVRFMVIEPAKGEYKHVFGNRKNVRVFGSNKQYTNLLRINPFKFPTHIHVMEHIDRLIEIFNVCWTMYDAMPAVLKQAILNAYQAKGWDLSESVNFTNRFPTFADLVTHLKQEIENSDYSQEVKSNYKGALITRITSLTNGLYQDIFTEQEIDNRWLFDSNVIVDLSRIGSQETKALIMGILVMRLGEYRSGSEQMNQPLQHVTVLEEAHHILPAQPNNSAGGNLSAKSVEMLANAIAEMRTYGEGFIIADQSPTAVDIAAIRNTNTKLILRLPDENDRQLAAKAAAVTDEQINEIAKLPQGVAVVYQNNWLEPVLCKIKHFSHNDNGKFSYSYTQAINDQAFRIS